MDARLANAPVAAAFADRLPAVVEVVGLYAGGSLASGDYHPGVSDLDLVAVIEAPLDSQHRAHVRQLHTSLAREDPAAVKLHCVYVPRTELTRLEARHRTWTAGRLLDRPLSTIARAELLAGGVVIVGPAPEQLLAPVTRAALDAAVRSELTGYWSGVVRQPWVWLNDWCVDLGVITLPRARAALSDGRLITKREAIDRLKDSGVPVGLVDEITRRRNGETVHLSTVQRLRRARIARRVVASGIRSLTATPRETRHVTPPPRTSG